ncbi:hypothetical protein Bhyg_15425 [Pseudolycoriella hygida]|uniref:Uncharacterized protein n=1 Tax=Pseudolycoriella hygida TaxID=35572 RepID=A0A9Q0MRT9_9DIPT|nr:hypothetical protein Bhyg_15425 [Pseudolycoriella hygida]
MRMMEVCALGPETFSPSTLTNECFPSRPIALAAKQENLPERFFAADGSTKSNVISSALMALDGDVDDASVTMP